MLLVITNICCGLDVGVRPAAVKESRQDRQTLAPVGTGGNFILDCYAYLAS